MKIQNQAVSQEVSLLIQPMGSNLPKDQARPGFGNRRNARMAWSLLVPKSSLSVKNIRIILSNHKTKGSLWMPQQSMGWPHIWILRTQICRTPEHSPTTPKSPPTHSFHPIRLSTECCIKTLSRGWTLIKKEDTDMKMRKDLCTSSNPSTCFLIWICKTLMNLLTNTCPWDRKALSLIMTWTHTGQRRSRSHPNSRRQRQSTRT